MKERVEIEKKGTPPGIALLEADDSGVWIFELAVLGDETVYRVSLNHIVVQELISIRESPSHYG